MVQHSTYQGPPHRHTRSYIRGATQPSLNYCTLPMKKTNKRGRPTLSLKQRESLNWLKPSTLCIRPSWMISTKASLESTSCNSWITLGSGIVRFPNRSVTQTHPSLNRASTWTYHWQSTLGIKRGANSLLKPQTSPFQRPPCMVTTGTKHALRVRGMHQLWIAWRRTPAGNQTWNQWKIHWT